MGGKNCSFDGWICDLARDNHKDYQELEEVLERGLSSNMKTRLAKKLETNEYELSKRT